MTPLNFVYSVGTCPICPGFGPVLVLVRRDEAVAVYFCPACGTAWLSPPGEEVNEVNAIEELAPRGATPASEKDLRRLGVAHLVEETVPYENWKSELDEAIGSP